MRRILAALATAFLAAAAPPGLADSRITVTGVGEVSRAPDMASLSLGAAFEAESAAEAMAEVSDAVAATLAVLEAAGVPARDVQTQRLTLSPIYPDRSTSTPRGAGAEAFRAESGLAVVIRDLETLGPVLDAVLGSGANVFGGLSFGLQDPRPAEDKARVAAVADAMRKAELLAKAAGQSLGPVQLIREQEHYGGPMPMAEMSMARDAGVPVAQGELTVRASVTMEWELVEGVE
jgi:hypothetical protein